MTEIRQEPYLPKNVNPVAFDFTQIWLMERGQGLEDIKDVWQLKKAFSHFYMCWLCAEHQTSMHIFENWERRKFLRSSDSYLEDYYRIQEWVESSYLEDKRVSQLELWRTSKDVTFDSCLFILSKCGKLFGEPLLTIKGYYKDPSSEIQWNKSPKFFEPVKIKRR